jgi:hypothetical protein
MLISTREIAGEVFYVLTDPTRGIYRLASQSRADARRTIPKALAAPSSDWLSASQYQKAVGVLSHERSECAGREVCRGVYRNNPILEI